MFKKITVKPIWIVVILALIVILAFFSCQRSQFLIPNLIMENGSALEGLDPRPDVLAWIEKHYGSDPKRKMAMLRLAEADQYILAAPDDVDKASDLNSVAMACYDIAFSSDRPTIDGEPIFEAISTQTFNTWKRARARSAYFGRLSGRVLQLHEIQSWEKECAQPLPR